MAGSTAFVFVPGLHGTKGLYAPLLKFLPGKALELPKAGPQDYASLSAWLSSQRFPKSYILVGESFGGPLSLLHASRRPQGLRGLALLGSFAHMGLPAAGPLSYLVPPLPMSWGLFRGINQRLLYSGGATEAELDFFRDEVAGISPWIFRARFQAVMRGDLRAALPAIKVPVLSVRGLRDQLVPAEAEKALLAIQDLRQASLDSPHVIAATRPRELAQLLKKFRDSI